MFDSFGFNIFLLCHIADGGVDERTVFVVYVFRMCGVKYRRSIHLQKLF